ncbi:type VI secretion system ATPase TssH [Cupriavidus sp. D39]|uniref:type VI secretion system ATPase TssH n=1 Tax=Cupriavidus sp. D39 TaxID=2997877 RepID=UPI00226EF24C|nr:type VI secretion system ATPase TssH [Cupriavidus sp. D39]MCY0858665.1 type VI secretion system ATPase TssH [Cupriavidus sp. D39]
MARYCINFTERAIAGAIDPVIGRDREIRQVIEILSRRRKNNPIVVGEPGVGKTAVVEGLALRISAGDVPPPLRGAVLLGLDVGALEAGAGVRGEFENRLRQVVREIEALTEPAVLFIDEAHVIVRPPSAGGNDFANLLKPALANGTLRAVAATTWSEYKKYFEKDLALARRFQVVAVGEPSIAQAKVILRGLRERYEADHGVFVSDAGLEAAVDLADRYIHGRQLPDKALDLFDTACAQVAIGLSSTPEEIETVENQIEALEVQRQGLERELRHGRRTENELASMDNALTDWRAQREELIGRWRKEEEIVREVIELRTKLASAPPEVLAEIGMQLVAAEVRLADIQGDAPMVCSEVGPDVVAKVVSRWTGIPLGKVLRDQTESILALADSLRRRVRGQDHALTLVAETVRSAAAGLKDPRQPRGVFLLVGPSGTGKTETALALADVLFGDERSAIILNMTEYREAHSVSRLIGSPPGYVGYGEGGVLTEAVRQRPYSVILLDEVEKAHLDVMNLFYQVFDKGMLSDGEGKLIDFSQTVILMTSNLASEAIADGMASRGETMASLEDRIRPLLNAHFKPALLARMTVIPYLALSPEVVREVIEMKLARLADRMRCNHGMEMRYSTEVIETIASRCSANEAGARYADMLIRTEVVSLLSEGILQRLVDQTALPAAVTLEVDETDGFSCRFEG